MKKIFHDCSKFDVKPDSELFVFDTQGDDEAKELPAEVKPEGVVKPRSAKERKRQQLTATPKCFEVLLPTSKVILCALLRQYLFYYC